MCRRSPGTWSVNTLPSLWLLEGFLLRGPRVDFHRERDPPSQWSPTKTRTAFKVSCGHLHMDGLLIPGSFSCPTPKCHGIVCFLQSGQFISNNTGE